MNRSQAKISRRLAVGAVIVLAVAFVVWYFLSRETVITQPGTVPPDTGLLFLAFGSDHQRRVLASGADGEQTTHA